MAGALLEVGSIGRPHGLRGDVVVHLVTNRLERVEPGAVLTTDRGDLRVASSRPQKGGFVVHFEGVDDRIAAERLNGVVLRAEPIDDPDALWVHDLVGAAVVDLTGQPLGVVTAVVANPASDLLELDGSALVPVRFVVSAADGVVVVDPPVGLLD